MKNFILCTILIFCLLFSVKAQTIKHTELLGRPTDNSICVKMFFADTVDVYAEYGTSTGVYTSQTSTQTFVADSPVVIIISSLQADTKYFYRINYRKNGAANFIARPEFSFHTQRSTGSTFTFVVQADPHIDANSDTALYRLCLQNQLDDAPDFMIDLGDFLMTDKLKDPTINQIPHDTITYRCNLLRSFYETSVHSVPLFISLGNHEGEMDYYLLKN